MPCYTITCGGWGRDIYSFPDERTAILHPVVQVGDAVITCLEDLVQSYEYRDVPRMLRLLGINQEADESEDLLPRIKFLPEKEIYAKKLHRLALEEVIKRAVPPPMESEAILEAIRRHRAFVVQVLHFGRKAESMSEQGTETVMAPRAPRTGRLDPHATIHFGSSSDGAKYDTAENSPYRPGSNRQTRWSQLRDGMTVSEVCALDGYAAATLEREISEGKLVLG